MTRKYWIVISSILFVLVSLMGHLGCNDKSIIVAIGDELENQLNLYPNETDMEIRLDFTPASNSVSTFVNLCEDGWVKIIKYDRYQCKVFSISSKKLSSVDVKKILNKIREPSFQDFLNHENINERGIEPLDLFRLYLKVPNDVAKEVFGIVEGSPKVVQSLIKNLLELENNLDKDRLDKGYTRSIAIKKKRLERLQKAKNIRFASLEQFPIKIQPILREVLNNPYDFFALSETQYNQLLTWVSHGHDFFILNNDSGYQLTLFHLQN